MATFDYVIVKKKDKIGLLPSTLDGKKYLEGKLSKSNILTLSEAQNRILKHHKRLFAIIGKFTENINIDLTTEECLTYLKIKTGRYKTIKFKGADVIIPCSISFLKMNQKEFETFYNEAVCIMAGVLGVSKADLEMEAL